MPLGSYIDLMLYPVVGIMGCSLKKALDGGVRLFCSVRGTESPLAMLKEVRQPQVMFMESTCCWCHRCQGRLLLSCVSLVSLCGGDPQLQNIFIASFATIMNHNVNI